MTTEPGGPRKLDLPYGTRDLGKDVRDVDRDRTPDPGHSEGLPEARSELPRGSQEPGQPRAPRLGRLADLRAGRYRAAVPPFVDGLRVPPRLRLHVVRTPRLRTQHADHLPAPDHAVRDGLVGHPRDGRGPRPPGGPKSWALTPDTPRPIRPNRSRERQFRFTLTPCA